MPPPPESLPALQKALDQVGQLTSANEVSRDFEKLSRWAQTEAEAICLPASQGQGRRAGGGGVGGGDLKVCACQSVLGMAVTQKGGGGEPPV